MIKLPNFEISFPELLNFSLFRCIPCDLIETQCLNCKLNHCKKLTCDEAAIKEVIE